MKTKIMSVILGLLGFELKQIDTCENGECVSRTFVTNKEESFGASLIRAIVISAIIGLLSVTVLAAEFTGPQPIHPNYKQAKTEYSTMAWYDTDAREWLRISGNADAPTLSQQWGPGAITIESTRRPIVGETSTGFIITFK